MGCRSWPHAPPDDVRRTETPTQIRIKSTCQRPVVRAVRGRAGRRTSRPRSPAPARRPDASAQVRAMSRPSPVEPRSLRPRLTAVGGTPGPRSRTSSRTVPSSATSRTTAIAMPSGVWATAFSSSASSAVARSAAAQRTVDRPGRHRQRDVATLVLGERRPELEPVSRHGASRRSAGLRPHAAAGAPRGSRRSGCARAGPSAPRARPCGRSRAATRRRVGRRSAASAAGGTGRPRSRAPRRAARRSGRRAG